MKVLIPVFYIERKMRRGVETLAYETISRMIAARPNHTFVLMHYDKPVFCEYKNVQNVKISKNIVWNILWEFRQVFISANCDAFFCPGQYTFVGPQKKSVVVALDVAWKFFPKHFPLSMRISLDFLMRIVAHSSSQIAAISLSTAQDIERHYHISRDRIKITHLGYDPNQFTAVDEHLSSVCVSGQEIEPGFVLFVGTLQKRKNLSNLIHAFEKSQFCAHRFLVLAGTPGWFYEDIKATIASSCAKDRIIETGYISEAEKIILYQNAGVLIMPSLYEGFGIPLIEAMACGTPVLASNVSSMPEIVGNVKYLFDPSDIHSIASKLDFILNEENHKEAKAFALRQRLKFSWESATNTILDMLEKQ